jgi:hypothetical protein
MNDRLQLPFHFDPARLESDLARLESSAWVEHFVKQNYEGEWSALPLRGPAGESHPVRLIYPNPSCREFVDTPLLEATPYFREVLASFSAPLEAVRLMKLGAGSIIKEHTDHALTPEQGTVRLHIPVVTNPDVEFYLNGERVVMNAGECWYLRLSDPHAVANRGATDRVHMVIDVEVDTWMRDLLGKATH